MQDGTAEEGQWAAKALGYPPNPHRALGHSAVSSLPFAASAGP